MTERGIGERENGEKKEKMKKKRGISERMKGKEKSVKGGKGRRNQ